MDTTITVVSFTASIASLILAVGAIWLSIVFYRMSTAASNATTEAAKGIEASVARLEKLFDKLYSDTFSMMRDTVSDMRRHMWPTDDTEPKALEEAEKKADHKISELKDDMENRVSEILQRQRVSEDNVDALRTEMRQLVEHAIISSRNVEMEAREETVREHILRQMRLMRRRRARVTADDIVERLHSEFSLPSIITELERMKREGIMFWEGDEILPDTELRLV